MLFIPTSKPPHWAGVLLGLLSSMLLPAAPAAAQPGDNWAVCADEGQSCHIGKGEATVPFGANGRYAFRAARGQQACSIDAFGSDPAPGVRKCEVAGNWRQQESFNDWQDRLLRGTAGWTWCANEGDQCRVPSPAMVRYGANGHYAHREAFNDLRCDNNAFGVDPAPGGPKRCEVLRMR